jgi:hypothetical protein
MLEETLGGYSLQAFNVGNNAGMVVETGILSAIAILQQQ